MNTAEQESAVVAEHVESKPTEAVAETPRDFEAEARKDGWVPESEWKGEKRPAVFLDAETFVKKGEEFATFSRKENKALRKEIGDLKKTIETRVGKLANAARAGYEQQVKNYEREIARLKSEQEKAVEAGDVPGFRRLDAEIGKVPVPEEVDAPGEAGDAPDRDTLLEAFRAANTWYETDRVLTAYAKDISNQIAADTGDKLPLADNLKLVEQKMRKEFPEHYKTAKATNGNGHANVDGGSDFNGTSRSDPMQKYGNAERAQCVIDMKAFPTKYPTKAAWIAVYEGKK